MCSSWPLSTAGQGEEQEKVSNPTPQVFLVTRGFLMLLQSPIWETTNTWERPLPIPASLRGLTLHKMPQQVDLSPEGQAKENNAPAAHHKKIQGEHLNQVLIRQR